FGLTIVGWVMYWLFVSRLVSSNQAMPEPIVREYIFALIPVISVIFVVPIVTMRLLSEEKRTGTLEVLLTAPLGDVTVVLSKFFAALIFYMILWVPWGLFLLGLYAESRDGFDYRPLLSFYLAMMCTGAAFLSMGLFFSALSRNQIAAAILTFMGMMLLLGVWIIMQLPGT